MRHSPTNMTTKFTKARLMLDSQEDYQQNNLHFLKEAPKSANEAFGRVCLIDAPALLRQSLPELFRVAEEFSCSPHYIVSIHRNTGKNSHPSQCFWVHLIQEIQQLTISFLIITGFWKWSHWKELKKCALQKLILFKTLTHLISVAHLQTCSWTFLLHLTW